MPMVGRNRKPGKRHPNGQPYRAPSGPAPAAVARLKAAALSGLADPMWATPLGQLLAQGEITSTEYSAAVKWASLGTEYLRVKDAPTESARSSDLDRSPDRTLLDPNSKDGPKFARYIVKIRKDFEDARWRLTCESEEVHRAVTAVCGGAMPNGYAMRVALKEGLAALAEFWKLGKISE